MNNIHNRGRQEFAKKSALMDSLASRSRRAHGNAPRVIVIHETNGRKYLEALSALRDDGHIQSLEFRESSVLWKLFHGIFRERQPILVALQQAKVNLRFLMRCRGIRNHTIIICIPPWDARFLFFSVLRRNNRFIYNTSWPYWSGFRVPRPGRLLRSALRRHWLNSMLSQDVEIVAITDAAADGLAQVLPQKRISVIPHAASSLFFNLSAEFKSHPFRLVYVGELVEKRGLRTLLETMPMLQDVNVAVDIVGDGPLRHVAREICRLTGGIWHGHVRNRPHLVAIVASSQLLVSPSIATDRWEELFGMAIVEAMACGVPCIASNHVGPRSIITDGFDGILLRRSTPDELAREIRLFAHSPQRWMQFSIAAKRRALDFRLDTVTDLWRHILVATPESVKA